MNYDEEQEEIIRYIEKNIASKSEYTKQDPWKKWKGAFCSGVIKKHLEARLNKNELEVVGPNVYIEGVPNEIDLLIVKGGAEPIDEALTYKLEDICHIIEVKESFLKMNGINRFKKLKKIIPPKSSGESIGFSFIRLVDWQIDGIEDEFDDKREYFLLSEAGKVKMGEWEKFVESIQECSDNYDSALKLAS